MIARKGMSGMAPKNRRKCTPKTDNLKGVFLHFYEIVKIIAC
jgi:hypothetical protein